MYKISIISNAFVSGLYGSEGKYVNLGDGSGLKIYTTYFGGRNTIIEDSQVPKDIEAMAAKMQQIERMLGKYGIKVAKTIAACIAHIDYGGFHGIEQPAIHVQHVSGKTVYQENSLWINCLYAVESCRLWIVSKLYSLNLDIHESNCIYMGKGRFVWIDLLYRSESGDTK